MADKKKAGSLARRRAPPKAKKQKQWRGWAVMRGNQLKWVDLEDDARKSTIASINRPAGERAVEVIVTLSLARKATR